MRIRVHAAVTIAVVVALGLGTLGLAGCGGDDDSGEAAAPTGTTIVAKGGAFTPALLEVNLGDVVTFTNEDTADHQILIDGITLARQTPGQSVTWTPHEAGTIDYICTVNPNMRGRIIVK